MAKTQSAKAEPSEANADFLGIPTVQERLDRVLRNIVLSEAVIRADKDDGEITDELDAILGALMEAHDDVFWTLQRLNLKAKETIASSDDQASELKRLAGGAR